MSESRMRFIVVTLLLLALGSALTVGILREDGPDLPDTVPVENSGIPPCINEDGSGGPVPCVWVADERGNKTGDSYLIDRHGDTYYMGHDDARTMRSEPYCQ